MERKAKEICKKLSQSRQRKQLKMLTNFHETPKKKNTEKRPKAS